MMAAGKKKPEDTNTNIPVIERSFMEDAGGHLTRTPESSPGFDGPTREHLIRELQVHQINLETQAEDIRKMHLAPGESRDWFLDRYDFALTGYLTLTDRALIPGVDLMGTTHLGVERNDLVNHGFGRFITPGDLESWDQYFMHVRNRREKQICTLMLTRVDGSAYPEQLEECRLLSATGE